MSDVRETRYYIGLVNGKRVSFTVGPGEPNKFNVSAYTPVDGEYWSYYQVSQGIAEEWIEDTSDWEGKN